AELEAGIVRLRNERVLEEQLVELLPRVHVVAELEGDDPGAVERVLAGRRKRVGLAEVDVRLHPLRLGLRLDLRLERRQRLVGGGVLADLRGWPGTGRCAGQRGHRRGPRGATGEDQRGNRQREQQAETRHGEAPYQSREPCPSARSGPCPTRAAAALRPLPA